MYLTANFFSKIGLWVHDLGAAWLMASLAPTPLMVALIQSATSLPMALLALPAGALADIFDRKKLIIVTQALRIIVSMILGALTLFGLINPLLLLGLTFLLGIGTALGAPAWQAIIPDMVSKEEVPDAVTLGAVSSNTARGAGPALGGFIVTAVGCGGAFLLNAASMLWIMIVMTFWKRTARKSPLPAERFIGAIRTGIRYTKHSREVKNVLLHTFSFIFSASAMWALLPIIAKERMGLSSTGFGLLLGIFGAGGIGAISFIPAMRLKFRINHLTGAACGLFSLVLFALADASHTAILYGTLFIAGASYLILMSSIMTSLQSSTSSWVLGRVMSLHALVIFGSQAAGSAFWGVVAEFIGLPGALTCAGVLLIGGSALMYRYELTSGEAVDLTPMEEWRLAPLANRPGLEEGPVLVSIEYQIDPEKADAFTAAMGPMKTIRKKYGAISWNLFRNVATPGHYRESFIIESWVEHLRQHRRFTVSDIATLEHVNGFRIEGTGSPPEHFIAESVPGPTPDD